MSLVDADTGEVIETLTADQARALTDRIKVAVEATWHLVIEAYQGRAWATLGYSSWDDYCTREFGTSRLRLPREERQEVVASLRDSGLSLRAIAAATGESKDTVAREIRSGVSPATPDREIEPRFRSTVTPMKRPSKVVGMDGKSYAAKVEKAVEDEKEKVQQRAEDSKALRQLNDDAQAAGFDTDEASLRERGEFARLCRDLANLGSPEQFLERHGDRLTERHLTQAERAYAWLDEFLLLRKDNE